MIFKKIFITISLLSFPLIALAQGTGTVTPQVSPLLDRLKKVGPAAGYGQATETTAIEIVGMVINALLGLLGVIFIILMLLAGYNWLISRGDEEKITKAKDIIRTSIIGLIVVVGAFAIWNFISNYLLGGQ